MRNIPILSNTRLDELLDKEKRLQALELNGVQNWEHYNYALAEYNKNLEETKLIEDFIEGLLEQMALCIEDHVGNGASIGINKIDTVNLKHYLSRYIISRSPKP